jgi:type IV secretory pathway TrbL component
MGDPPASVSFTADDISQNTVLNGILAAFSKFIDNGGDRVVEAVAVVAGALLAYQLIRFIMVVGFSPGSIGKATLDFLTMFAWYTLATNAVTVCDAWLEFMGGFHTFLGASPVDNVMKSPDTIMLMGLKTSGALLDAARGLSGLTEPAVMLFSVVLAIGLIPIFLLLGGAVVFTVVRAKLSVCIGLALLPFAVERELRGVAERGLGMILDAGINMAMTGMVVTIGYGFMKEVLVTPVGDAVPQIKDGMSLLLSGALIGWMAFRTMVSASFGLRS